MLVGMDNIGLVLVDSIASLLRKEYDTRTARGVAERSTMLLHLATILKYIHPSISLFIHPFIHPSIHPFLYLSIHSFIHPSIHFFIYPSIHSSVHPSISLFIHPFICPSIHFFIYTSIHSSIHLSICLFIHPFLRSVAVDYQIPVSQLQHNKLIIVVVVVVIIIKVVVTNQITTKFMATNCSELLDTDKVITASLGNIWTHCINTRLILEFWEKSKRKVSHTHPLLMLLFVVEYSKESCLFSYQYDH